MEKNRIRAFARNNAIGLVALCVAIGGTAVAAQAGSDGGSATAAAKKKKKKAKAIPGPAGPQGPAGATGPAGPAGSDANLSKLGNLDEGSSGNVQITNSNTGTANADCPSPGQIAVTGGANIQAVPENTAIIGSYRQDSNTWTASADNQSGGNINLQVFVYCITP